jgi:hypothetical protein
MYILTTNFRADNRVLIWDIRSAKGALMVLDQYNGKAPSDNILGNILIIQKGICRITAVIKVEICIT